MCSFFVKTLSSSMFSGTNVFCLCHAHRFPVNPSKSVPSLVNRSADNRSVSVEQFNITDRGHVTAVDTLSSVVRMLTGCINEFSASMGKIRKQKQLQPASSQGLLFLF
ncbi:hypothetical protein ILYODFUR_026596 [Ilyodon furcidens]|uniref:Uncharacterized protein n=1 Tax=Ilyodon furcidens TaxID=33524 RepID=A0ABV0SPF6_9TELE